MTKIWGRYDKYALVDAGEFGFTLDRPHVIVARNETGSLRRVFSFEPADRRGALETLQNLHDGIVWQMAVDELKKAA